MEKTILITGAGFVAQGLLERIGGKVRVVARNESLLMALKVKYPNIDILPGDIADEMVAKRAVQGVSEVYHTAAFKYVTLAEEEPQRCIASNVVGTMNLLKHQKALRFVFVSTDKASNPIGVYGVTKYLCERIIHEEARHSATSFLIARFGNMFGSTGSFVMRWLEQKKNNKPIIITDRDATRFFITRDEVIDYLLSDHNAIAPAGPIMKVASMGQMLEAFIEVYGECNVKEIGLQRGEKMHEVVDGIESSTCKRFNHNELISLMRSL